MVLITRHIAKMALHHCNTCILKKSINIFKCARGIGEVGF